MLIALIVVIVVALVLGALLVLARSSLGELRTQSQERESALVDERDQLTRSKANLERELTRAEEEIDELTGRAESRAVRIEKLEAELDAARAEGTEQRTTIGDQAGEIDRQAQEMARQVEEMDALKADNNDLHERATAADTARAEATRRADDVEARYAGVPIDAIETADGAAPATLWGLELARSERTWRTSVAVDPTAVTGPFDDADDPVRLAVEIEAAALRENVGTYIAVDWQASPIDEPIRRHLIVRVAQEMLEAAARNSAPLRLVVTDEHLAEDGDDGEREDATSSTILLRLEPAEPSERTTVDVDPITIPDVSDGVIDVDTENGLAVSVRAE